MRQVHDGSRLSLRLVEPHIAHHTHDLARLFVGNEIEGDALPERIFVGPPALRHGFADDHHPRRGRRVGRIEVASLQHGNPDRGKVVRRDRHVGRRHCSTLAPALRSRFRRGTPLDLELHPHGARERWTAGAGRGNHSRQPLHALEQTVVGQRHVGADVPKPNAAILLAHGFHQLALREAEIERQQTFGIAAQVVALDAKKAVHHQSGADQQHQRQADLRGHQRAAQPLLRQALRSAAGGFLKRRGKIDLGGLQRRNQAEEQPGGDRNQGRERQNPAAQRHVRQARPREDWR